MFKIKLLVLEEGDIMYNPEYHGLHQIKEIKDKTVILGGCVNYYNDAKTNISRHEVKLEYLDKLKPVHKKLRKNKFMSFDTSINAWRVTKTKTNKTYSFYRDVNIVKDVVEKTSKPIYAHARGCTCCHRCCGYC